MSKIKSIGLRISRAKPGFVVLGWGVSIAGLALTAILQGITIPHSAKSYPQAGTELLGETLYYAGIFGVSILAGLLLANIATALLGFFASYGLGMLLTYLALILPGLAGIIPESGAEVSAIVFTFTALFPFALLVGLVAGVLGAASTEP